MMQRLQALFNSLVGIHHNDAMLRARARMIFEQPQVHFQSMDAQRTCDADRVLGFRFDD